jgi:hypothetical protein
MSTITPSPALPQQPRPAVRIAVSALVMFHVLAVFIGPFAMPPGTSQLASTCASIFQPYVESLCLANGYRFFAPEPGPSHLVRYEITLADGTRTHGVFPDRQQHVPRLLYHRYFMLSEFINTIDNGDAPQGPAADAARGPGQAFAKAYAQHLADEYQAKTVNLYLRRHYVPRMSEVHQGMRLSDKALYEERPLFSLSNEKKPDADP